MQYYYQEQLRPYMSLKQISEKIKEIKGHREWQSKYFENSYVNRTLHSILEAYKNGTNFTQVKS